MRRGRVTEAPRLARRRSRRWTSITRKVTRGGQPVELTVREFELLEYLMRHQGQVVSRETLARDVWKETARTTPLDNVIDVHIARLRRKVDLDHAVEADSHRSRRRLHAAGRRAMTTAGGVLHGVRVRLTLWYVGGDDRRARRLRRRSSSSFVSRSVSQALDEQAARRLLRSRRR